MDWPFPVICPEVFTHSAPLGDTPASPHPFSGGISKDSQIIPFIPLFCHSHSVLVHKGLQDGIGSQLQGYSSPK